jgi:hypothetical protein
MTSNQPEPTKRSRPFFMPRPASVHTYLLECTVEWDGDDYRFRMNFVGAQAPIKGDFITIFGVDRYDLEVVSRHLHPTGNYTHHTTPSIGLRLKLPENMTPEILKSELRTDGNPNNLVNDDF